MKEIMLDILSTYNLQTQHELIFLNSIFSSKTARLRRKRRRHIRNIRMLQEKKLELCQLVLRDPKQNCAKTRHSDFWEREVVENDDNFFKENFRLSPSSFELLCKELKSMERKDSNRLKCVTLQKRIAIALYTLGSNKPCSEIGEKFGVGTSTCFGMLTTFCSQTLKILGPKYLVQKDLLEVMNYDELVESFYATEEECSDEIKFTDHFMKLSSRFKRVSREITLDKKFSVAVIKASCVLNDFLELHNDTMVED